MLFYGLGADILQPISVISSSFFSSKDEISAPSNREENERCLTSCSDKMNEYVGTGCKWELFETSKG